MQVQIISLGHSSERFTFLAPLVKALEEASPLQSVYFPDVGGSTKAEVVLEECIDRNDDVPVGILQFKSAEAQSQMLYRAEVREINLPAYGGTGPAKGLRLTMRVPNDSDKKIYSTGSIDLRSYACVVKQIAQYFTPGAVYRKIVPLKVKKPLPKKENCE